MAATKSNKSKQSVSKKAGSKKTGKGLNWYIFAKKKTRKTKRTKANPGVNNRFLLATGGLFILVSLVLGYGPFVSYWQERQRDMGNPNPPVNTQQLQTHKKTNEIIQGKPVRIEIPSLSINIPVADGVYNPAKQSWTLSKDKAHFALMTTMPNNQEGNTFIYGHNRKEVFSKLSKMKAGQIAEVYTENGHKFTYRYRSSYETHPNDDALFRYKGAPILTLQTCSGVWYENRLLMTLDLVEVT